MLPLHYVRQALYRTKRLRSSGHPPYLLIGLVYISLWLLHSYSRFQLRPSTGAPGHQAKREAVLGLRRFVPSAEAPGDEAVSKHTNTVAKAVSKHTNTVAETYDYDDVTEEEIALLTHTFNSADIDANKLLSVDEISSAITILTNKHVKAALRNNFKIFFSLDKDKKNGQVEWDEYYGYFLKTRLGLDEKTIRDISKHPNKATREIKESISRLRASWSEAARTNPDAVNIDEFLGLEHPESSHSLLTQRVEEVLNKYDDDHDGHLTRTEYLHDPFQDLSSGEVEARKIEFDHLMDKNKDGVADRKELVGFLDPKSSHWAGAEAADLVEGGDKDEDGMITVEEMIASPDLFLFSKLVSPEYSFHGEF